MGVTIWSLATAACGFAQNFVHLLFARVGVGVGEASLNPTASSMIADLFPREKLTTAMAIYAIGATVGSGTALIIGGAIVEFVSHLDRIVLPLVGEIRPWQAVFFIVGVPGALLALINFHCPGACAPRSAHTAERRIRLRASPDCSSSYKDIRDSSSCTIWGSHLRQPSRPAAFPGIRST